MTHTFRTLHAVTLAVVALAACVSTATASGAQYDAGYGTVALPSARGSNNLLVTKCTSLNSNLLALVAQPNGGGTVSTTREITKILIARTSGTSKSRWRTVKSGVGEAMVASDFSPTGEFAYVDAPVYNRKAAVFVVRKASRNGAPDDRWKDVTIELPAPKKGGSFKDVNLINLHDGGVLVSVNRFDGLRFFRFGRSGRPAHFGTNGVVTLPRMKYASWFLSNHAMTPLLETYDGSVIVAAPGRPGQSRTTEGIGLLKLSRTGAVDDGWADHGFWTPPIVLAGEKPLEPGQTRVDAETMSIVGGQAAGMPLTVLFGTRAESQIGFQIEIAAARLSEAGVQSTVTKGFDDATNAGDGGFPIAQPFDFRQTATGFTYAGAWTTLESEGKSSSFGTIVGLDPLLTMPPKPSRISLIENKFTAYDYAATSNGKYIYACGGQRPLRVTSGTVGTSVVPTLRRFKL